MNRILKLGGMAVLAVMMLAPGASAQRMVFRGGWGRGFYGGPAFYYGYGPGFYYGPGWYGPGAYGLGWYEPYGFVPGNAAGKVKFETKMKDAQVYVDGGLAGTVKQLGTFPLKSGAHDLEVRGTNGQTLYQEHIDVVSGKTMKIKF